MKILYNTATADFVLGCFVYERLFLVASLACSYEILFEDTVKDVVVSNRAALCISFFPITCWTGCLSFNFKLLHKMSRFLIALVIAETLHFNKALAVVW